MAAKIYFVLCTATVFIQSITAQCLGSALAGEELGLGAGALAYGPGLAANRIAYGGAPYGAFEQGAGFGGAPANGGGFLVNSFSPISPTGIQVVSENAIEGALTLAGELPFLGAVALEGALPTAGAGGIDYGCGNGAVGIVSEGIAPAFGPAAAAAVGPNRFGYGAGVGPGFGASGLSGPGFGYNGLPGYY